MSFLQAMGAIAKQGTPAPNTNVDPAISDVLNLDIETVQDWSKKKLHACLSCCTCDTACNCDYWGSVGSYAVGCCCC